MWLAIEAGNTHAAIGVFGEADDASATPNPRPVLRIPTHGASSAGELRLSVSAALQAVDLRLEDAAEIRVASVVPKFTALAREAFPAARLLVSPRFSFRIASRQTGIDRLLNAEAVVQEARYPAILVDAGTATTICAVDAEPAFLGGAILPGLEVAREGLRLRAPVLPAFERVAPSQAIGTDTDSALRSGWLLGYASMVDGMIARMRDELGLKARVIATGGDGPLLKELCALIDECDPELTLRGMAYLARGGRT